MNSPTFVLTLSKLIQSQVISSVEADDRRFSLMKTFIIIFWCLTLNNTFVTTCELCNFITLHFECQCLLYYMWICCDTCMTSRQPSDVSASIPGPGVWQIGIRAIDYSELVNILNQRKPIFTTIVTRLGTKLWTKNKLYKLKDRIKHTRLPQLLLERHH